MTRKFFLSAAVLMLLAPAAVSGREAPVRLSVMYFENMTQDENYDYFRKALSGMLISQLVNYKGIELLERENLEKLVNEMRLGMTGLIDEGTAPELGKLLGVEYVVTGKFMVLGEKITGSCAVTEVETGHIVGAGDFDGDAGDILKLKSSLSVLIADSLKKIFPDITAPPSAGEEKAKIGIDRAMDYGKALDLEDSGKYDDAKDILQGLLKDAPGWSAAEAEMKGVEKRIAKYDKVRSEMLKKEESGELTWNNYIKLTANYSGSMQYTKLVALCRRARKNPPDAPENSMFSQKELNDYYMTFALYSLKKWEGFRAEAENFLSAYPTSMYYSSVKSFLNNSMTQMENLDKNRKKAAKKVDKLKKKIKEESEFNYRAGQTYLSAGLWAGALEYFKKVNMDKFPKKKKDDMKEQVLYDCFLCYYNLLEKAEAGKIYRFMKTFYPGSDYLEPMNSMMNAFPE